jgi:predicted protein tyrosine phosphatase
MIHVSSLNGLNAVAARLPSFHLLSLLSPTHDNETLRQLARDSHLRLTFHDIMEVTPGLIAPDRDAIEAILDFGRRGTPDIPLVIHCWAGISRSSAAAFMIACDRNGGYEREIADELRRRAPFATPNRLMVRLSDEVLARDGRMVEAIDRSGRGAEAFEGTAYTLPLQWPLTIV